MTKKQIGFWLLWCVSGFAVAQRYTVANVHSHNDYAQAVPFFGAFRQHCGSIEADVFLKDGQLYVAHTPVQIKVENTFQRLYLNPLSEVPYFEKYPLQLLIDLKTAYEPTLDLLIKQLEQYPDIFGNQGWILVVISGNMPKPENFSKYPRWISFDGRFEQNYSKKNIRKLGLMSSSMASVVPKWDGTEPLSTAERQKVSALVKQATSYNKKIRFWATPDTPTAWKELVSLGVDWIGTDQPAQLIAFLNKK